MPPCRLDPALFDADGRMHPEVRRALISAARVFMDVVDIPWRKTRDVVVTGSSAGCGTWDAASDIDLHVLVDPDSIADCDPEFVERALVTASRHFDRTFDPRFAGRDLEVRLQSTDEPHASQGVYSVLRDRWLVPPRPVDRDVQRLAMRLARELHPRIVAVARRAARRGDVDTVDRVRDLIATMRRSALRRRGPGSAGAELFRALRRLGTLSALAAARREAVERAMSWPSAQTEEADQRRGATLLVAGRRAAVADDPGETQAFLSSLPPGTPWTLVRIDPPWLVADLATEHGRRAVTAAAHRHGLEPLLALRAVERAVETGEALPVDLRDALLASRVGALTVGGRLHTSALISPQVLTLAHGVTRRSLGDHGYRCIATEAPGPGSSCARQVWAAARRAPADAAEEVAAAALEGGLPESAARALGVLADPRSRDAEIAEAVIGAVSSRTSLRRFVQGLLAERGRSLADLLVSPVVPDALRRRLADVVREEMADVATPEDLAAAGKVTPPAGRADVHDAIEALRRNRGLTEAERTAVARWLVRHVGLARPLARRLASGRYDDREIVELLAHAPTDRDDVFDLALLYRGRPADVARELEEMLGEGDPRPAMASAALIRHLIRMRERGGR